MAYRTRTSCLEGKNPNHWTNVADYLDVDFNLIYVTNKFGAINYLLRPFPNTSSSSSRIVIYTVQSVSDTV